MQISFQFINTYGMLMHNTKVITINGNTNFILHIRIDYVLKTFFVLTLFSIYKTNYYWDAWQQ